MLFRSYIIKNEAGEEIVNAQEILKIDGILDYTKSFYLSPDTKPGVYIFYMRVTYQDDLASSSAWFSVGDKSGELTLQKLVIPGIIISIEIGRASCRERV